MVIEILVAERQRVDPLRHQLADRVSDQFWISPVDEAFRQPPQQVQLAVGFAQQQATSVESRRHLA